jgi:hypothetical protein
MGSVIWSTARALCCLSGHLVCLRGQIVDTEQTACLFVPPHPLVVVDWLKPERLRNPRTRWCAGPGGVLAASLASPGLGAALGSHNPKGEKPATGVPRARHSKAGHLSHTSPLLA